MSDIVFRSGLVNLTGRPNSGKSTLLNQYAGMHLAITSPKPQTTRQVIRAILDEPGYQIIFLDTPGLHTPKTRLGQMMMNSAQAALADADISVLLIDADAATENDRRPQVPALERNWLAKAGQAGKPVILVMNKIDRIAKEVLLPLIAVYAAAFPFQAIIPMSARTGDGADLLLGEIRKLLPPGPQYYPVDSLTDQTERSMAAELIREQILLQTGEEIPHGVAVEIEAYDERQPADVGGEPAEDADRSLIRIMAVIYCDKESHKGILIGKQGSMLKKLGTAARLQIEQMTGCPCYLELFVKVREGWRDRRNILRDLGYEPRP